MTDQIDTSSEAVNLMASQLNVAGLDEYEAKLTSDAAVVLRALSARVAELEVQVSEDDVLIAECESVIQRQEQRAAELEERYLAIAGDKINLRGEVETLEAKLAKADAWQEAVFAAHPNIDLDIETKENDT